MSIQNLEGYLEDWEELEKEYKQLEEQHREYVKQVNEVKSVQQKCIAGIAHQRYRTKQVIEGFNRLKKTASAEERKQMEEITEKIKLKKNTFRDMEDVLPHENGLYLKVILGSVNVSLLSKKDKYRYKEDYETFKLVLTCITIICTILLYFFQTRVTDAAFQFLLVWYYCTLTIREHILKVNGSRIKGWWITHHFVSTVCAGIILIWPDGYTYSQFRDQFVVFSFYIALLQGFQVYYQKGSLYKLRALGERHRMDVSVEGFQSSMWRGLGFILPFLAIGYLFQLYNAYCLYRLSQDERCVEWQVIWLSYIFMALFIGNSWTLVVVVRQKVKQFKTSDVLRQFETIVRNKYDFNHKINNGKENHHKE